MEKVPLSVNEAVLYINKLLDQANKFHEKEISNDTCAV